MVFIHEQSRDAKVIGVWSRMGSFTSSGSLPLWVHESATQPNKGDGDHTPHRAKTPACTERLPPQRLGPTPSDGVELLVVGAGSE
jgi:hypothetical protein